MIFQSAKHIYRTVNDSFKGACNDVYVCEDISSSIKNKYTVWAIHSRDISRTLVGILENSETDMDVIEWFVSDSDLCVVLPFDQKRELFSFYNGEVMSLHDCETVCMNLVTSCIQMKLPVQLKYLIVRQRLINLARDLSVSFSYDLNLTDLDENTSEAELAGACAEVLRVLLEPKKKEKALSYNLLEKKIPKKVYSSLPELYKDISLAAVPPARIKLKRRIAGWFERNKDTIFRILLVLCIILAVFALIVIASNLVLGDVPIYRLFVNPFKQIGTLDLSK